MVKLVLVIFLLAGTTQAQTVKEPTPWNWQFIESSAVYWSGKGADWISTRGVGESNGILRNDRGRLNNKMFWGWNATAYGVTLIFQKKYPRLMNWLRRGSGGISFGVAFYNWRRDLNPNQRAR